jgi:hypothetical protein
MHLLPATKPSLTSIAGERSDSWRWVPAIRGDTIPPYLRGDGGDIGDHRKKDEKGELLEHQI